jgi:hypothetical protein
MSIPNESTVVRPIEGIYKKTHVYQVIPVELLKGLRVSLLKKKKDVYENGEKEEYDTIKTGTIKDIVKALIHENTVMTITDDNGQEEEPKEKFTHIQFHKDAINDVRVENVIKTLNDPNAINFYRGGKRVRKNKTRKTKLSKRRKSNKRKSNKRK